MTRLFTAAAALLLTILIVVGFTDSDPVGWKLAPDPSIVNFDRADAERVTQALVAPPFLPEHDQVATTPPRVVQIRMEIVEREVEIAPGVFVWQMAFDNHVPGPVPVVFQWDWVELTLVNGTDKAIDFRRGGSGNQMAHNIDFHAAAGAMGGGDLTTVAPGQEVEVTWRATKAGFFVYHCAPGGEMVPYHVTTGGNGALLVLPREGLRDGYGHPVRYDRAFYFGEQDYYVPMNDDGTSKRFDGFIEQMGPMLEVMRGLTPTHIAFNGKYGALTEDIRLEAEVGETVLLLHSQANNSSAPHLIGGHGDWVWPYGKFNNRPMEGLESWDVVPGGTAAAVYTFTQGGTYAYLNHNLIKAFLYDAKALIHVEGELDDQMMEQTRAPESAGVR
ncbi:MAG: copper-containing nitrite reductase [Longimicrobiales bacterium]|nr:copper-containing nitrite reductase [Longimicrobiales bacterium]